VWEDSLPRAAKRFLALTATDFAVSPVWRYWKVPAVSSDPPESIVVGYRVAETEWVEPSALTALTEDTDLVYLAATEFRLASGEVLLGYCSPQDASGLDYIQPVILTPRGPVPLWYDIPVPPEVFASVMERLPSPSSSAFPVHYRCLVPCDGSFLEGVVDSVWMPNKVLW
jgi:hypothetical protein